MYLNPSIAQSELRTLARGKRPTIPVKILAHYLLMSYGSRAEVKAPKPKDDFVRFAERLHALPDPRRAGASSAGCSPPRFH